MKNFFKSSKNKKPEKKVSMTTKLEGGGGGYKALVVSPLEKQLFFAASRIAFCYSIIKIKEAKRICEKYDLADSF